MNVPTSEPIVLVCTPVRDTMEPETHHALRDNIGMPSLHLTEVGRPVDDARNALAARALAASRSRFAGHDVFVAWVDADCWFPPGAMRRMINALRLSGAALVCGNYCLRLPHAHPNVLIRRKNGSLGVPRYGVDYTRGDVLSIEFVGAHFMLHRASLLERLGEAPWSLFDGMTEDASFTTRVRRVGSIRMLTACDIAHVEDGTAFVPYSPAGTITGNRFVAGTNRTALVTSPVRLRSYGDRVDAAMRNGMKDLFALGMVTQ